MSPKSKYWGDVSPCPIGIDAPGWVEEDKSLATVYAIYFLFQRYRHRSFIYCLVTEQYINEIMRKIMRKNYCLVIREGK